MWLRGIVVAAGLACGVALVDAQGRGAGTGDGAVRHVAVEERSILDLQQAMASGAATSREITSASLARIAAYDRRGPALNAMIALNPRALEEADRLDAERRAGKVRGPLHGIPIVIKDNYETVDLPTTGGSMALAGFMTGRDAFQVRKLRDAGAVIVGKTNLHELAAGIISISSLGGQTRNPYDPARTPGGSSGGSGAAVAASFAAIGMASDTCGSIRIPAANNNLFGLRGTSGLSSRTGIIPLSHTQDIGGPLARTVTDLAIALDATVGEDPADPVTSASVGHIPASYRDALAPDALKGVRIGVLRNLFGSAPEDEEVAAIVRTALDAMKAQGAELVDVTIPGLDEQLASSSLINLEFKTDLIAYLAQFPQAPVRSLQDILDRGAFHAALETTFKLRNAAVADPAAIKRVEARRQAALALTTAAFAEHGVDVFTYPTLRRRPVVVEEPQRGTNCQLSATTGLPAIAMPAGFTSDGVPIGFELLGAAWSEPRLLAMAYAYEQAARPRRAAPTTPALVNGAPPRPVSVELGPAPGSAAGGESAHVTVGYDYVSGELRWAFKSPATITAAAIHRAQPGADGPVVARVIDPAAPARTGTLILPASLRSGLLEGTLKLSIHTPQGRTVVDLRVPAPAK
jgi:Asp-tRNA(Asn)/Glu-tRNA(Gln) amidotransferase A subunit family amidase